ncbi:MAG: glycosyltransferase family 2 protein [Ruthenibacterium sp.]
MMVSISIIVPVYCAERTLDACVHSLLMQSNTDFEILLVDDGSTDGSAALCKAWAARDKRIRALHKENGGVQSAVLFGLANASAPYCAFVDSDDTVKPEFLSAMLTAAQRTSADIVCCGYADIAQDGTEKIAWSRPQEQLFTAEEIRAALDTFFAENADLTAFCGAPRWNKLYKTQLLRTIAPQLDAGQTLGEDTLMNLYALTQCGALVIVPYVGYCYTEQTDSATRSISMKKYDQYARMQVLLQQAAKTMKQAAPALQKRQDELYSALILQALTAMLPYREKRQVVCALLHDIADRDRLRGFATTQLAHGRLSLQWIAAGMVTPTVTAVNIAQTLRKVLLLQRNSCKQ